MTQTVHAARFEISFDVCCVIVPVPETVQGNNLTMIEELT